MSQPCDCPRCTHERSGSTAIYIPYGEELLAELDAHPDRAQRMLYNMRQLLTEARDAT